MTVFISGKKAFRGSISGGAILISYWAIVSDKRMPEPVQYFISTYKSQGYTLHVQGKNGLRGWIEERIGFLKGAEAEFGVTKVGCNPDLLLGEVPFGDGGPELLSGKDLGFAR